MEENEQTTAAVRPPSPWMTTDEAAGYLSVAPGTLRNWRVDGQGPRANVVGRIVRYHRESLDAFMDGGQPTAGGAA